MKDKRKPRICFVSSSGGHWEQLQKLKPLSDKYTGFFVTEKTKIGSALAKYHMLQTDHKDKLMLLKMLLNALYATLIWVKERPDFVITTGTMVAYPFYILSVLFRRKFVFIETFGRVGKPTIAALKMQKRASLVLVQWESQLQLYEKAVYAGILY